jgi:hypothetical protein
MDAPDPFGRMEFGAVCARLVSRLHDQSAMANSSRARIYGPPEISHVVLESGLSEGLGAASVPPGKEKGRWARKTHADHTHQVTCFCLHAVRVAWE